MKKQITLGLIGMLLAALGSHKTIAQDDAKKKETQEIVIRKTNEKNTKLVIEFNDGKVIINGKPLMEFNEEGLTVNNKKIMMVNGNKLYINPGERNELILQGEKMKELSKQWKEQGRQWSDQAKVWSEQGNRLRMLRDGDHYSFGYNDDGNSWSESREYTFLGVSTTKDEKGVKITNITEDGPADKAGLKEGDVIYKIEDTEISSSAALSKTVRAMKAGDKAKVYYYRDGKKKDTKATLTTHKSTDVRTYSFSAPNINVNPQIDIPEMNFDFDRVFVRGQGRLGINIQDIEEGNGVKVIDADADAAGAKAGLMKDDVITEINGAKISNTDDARAQLAAVAGKNEYIVKARRGGAEQTFTVKIPKKLKTANL